MSRGFLIAVGCVILAGIIAAPGVGLFLYAWLLMDIVLLICTWDIKVNIPRLKVSKTTIGKIDRYYKFFIMFVLGATLSAMLSYEFHWGDWVNKVGELIPWIIVATATVRWVFVERSFKQHSEPDNAS